MEEKGIFRSAIGGFNKNDVLTYIDRITGEWNEERVELTEAADAARQEAQRQIAAAQEAVTAADEARAATEELRRQLEALTADLEEMTAQRDEARGETAAVREQLEREKDKIGTATNEMMAAEERLQAREQELASLRQEMNTQQEQIAQYAAVLGRCDAVQGHVDGIVRPFIEDANRRATDTLTSVHTLLDAMLTQMSELKQDVEQQQETLRQRKGESDTRLADTLDSWTTKARQLAQDAAGRVTRFFR